ncbi:MAG: site-specific DNA-methyltransferase [Sphaerochaetaceae bacterium]|nr:site-specific DNA-methyltransferase [Candidatus Cloacimonadota bacterium]
MEKMKMSTPDLTDVNIEKIGALFPNIITETRNESGEIIKAVDFDLLKQALSKSLVEDENERYRLDWPGKKASLLKANTPITKTLRPCREESVNFDTTENLYIEGDNFEVLKILQESYLGRIKMIYIDPPYNTGNDFIYRDNFSKNKDEYEQELGLTDEEGGKLFKNTDTNGRYHSDWLSMMYERLLVARDFLSDDGVIFISIDDNEVHNLRKICDEILGESNFIATIVWKHTQQSKNDERHFSRQFNYNIVYAKNILDLPDFYFDRTEEDNKNYANPDNDPKGYWRSGDVRSPNYRRTLCFDIIAPNGKVINAPANGWRWSEASIKEKIKTGEIIFKNDGSGIIRKIYLADQSGRTPENLWEGVSFGTTRQATAVIKELFDGIQVYDTPKPKELIIAMMKIASDPDDIILDFFSGSSTTAHAVMQLNAEDGGNRKFIMVQLPESCDQNSEAYKTGYKTIAEIGKERIRRAGKKIVEEMKDKNQQLELGEVPVDLTKLDIGFRVYKSDTSNLKDVFYHPSELDQEMLSSLESNIKENRTPEDLLTQVILDLGLELTLPIEINQILGNTVYFVQTNALVACFDENVDFNIVDHIADHKPLRVVFRDASFVDDKDRINVEERFKRLSPETKVTVI